MKLYTYEVSTRVGNFERIGVELQAKIVDLNLACTAYFYEKKEPEPYDYASFLIPPNMVKYLEGGERSKKAAIQSLEFIKNSLEDRKKGCRSQG